MYAYPLYPERKTESLDGIWDFAWLGADAPKLEAVQFGDIAYGEIAAVPGCFDAAPKYAGKRGVAAYRRCVAAPGGTMLRLRIGALGLRGRILWDGRELGLNELPYSLQEYTFDSGEGDCHELAILIDNRLDFNDTPLFHYFYDFYGYGGIYRSVELETLPEGVRFGRVRVETLDCAGKVRLSGRLSGGPAELSAGFDGAKPERIDAAFDGETFSFETTLPDPTLWSPDAPNLHTVTLKAGNDAIVERFGLRTVRCEKGEILLNGEPVRLYGYNRHDAHPQFGPAMPDELWIEDLQILRDMLTGPPVQDLWLMLPGPAESCPDELAELLAGYESLRDFDRGSLRQIELLRAMRMIYFLDWCAKQRGDWNFQQRWPDWGTDPFWRVEINALEAQYQTITEES